MTHLDARPGPITLFVRLVDALDAGDRKRERGIRGELAELGFSLLIHRSRRKGAALHRADTLGMIHRIPRVTSPCDAEGCRKPTLKSEDPGVAPWALDIVPLRVKGAARP